MKQGLLNDLLTRGIDANGNLRPLQSEAPHLYKQTPLGWLPKRWDCVELGKCDRNDRFRVGARLALKRRRLQVNGVS